MAPKVKNKPKAKPPALVPKQDPDNHADSNGCDGTSSSAVSINPAVLNMNAAHLEYIKECIRIITAHPIMADIVGAAPLSQADGAREAPLDIRGYAHSMTTCRTAKAGCNFFWQDFGLDHLIAHVPLKRNKINKLAATRFKTPTYCTDIHIAMDRGVSPFDRKGHGVGFEFDFPCLLLLCFPPPPLPRAIGIPYHPTPKGNLRRLSPAEPAHAMLIAIRRDVEVGDEQVIHAWRQICLSTSMIFQEFENNEAYHFAHLQLRENPGIDFELVRHTALHRILDIAQFASRTFIETGTRHSPKSLAALYTGRLELSDQSEKITESFCDMSLTVHNRLVLKSPDVFQLLLQLDESDGIHNPLD